MASPLLVALEAQLTNLKSFFIVEREDYFLYTSEDHAKALSFRLLCSASIEDYVEKRCLEIAKLGSLRVSRGQPTATGRALITWSVVRGSSRGFPIHADDVLDCLDLAEQALNAYSQSVKSTHGMSGKDLRGLVYPLGLRDHQVPTILTDLLNSLSRARDPASHVYVNRAKSMVEPVEEWRLVAQLLPHLRSWTTTLRMWRRTTRCERPAAEPSGSRGGLRPPASHPA